MMPDAAPSDTEAALLDEAIGALRIAGRIVQRLADGTFSIDGAEPITPGAVVAIAVDLGSPDEDPTSTQ